MIRMHGNFDLRPAFTASDYQAAFDAFCRHLRDQGFATSWSFAGRVAHPGYDRLPPPTGYYVSIDFPDMPTAEACFAYVGRDDEPIRTLHRAMNRQVEPVSTQFYLTADL